MPEFLCQGMYINFSTFHYILFRMYTHWLLYHAVMLNLCNFVCGIVNLVHPENATVH